MLIKSNKRAEHSVKFAVSALTMAIITATLMVSPARADDLEIYQPALTGGGKTLLLMLDASGQMNSGNPSGISQVVAGLQNLLKTDDPSVNGVALGLGHFNSVNDTGGSQNSGDIVVPAAPLGTLASSLPDSNGVPTTGQRKKLWDMVIAGTGNGSNRIVVNDPNDPTHTFVFSGNSSASPAQGFAEAAAYILGTTTAPHADSGFAASISTSKSGSHYASPLSYTGTCGGTGIYFLTSGQFVSTTTTVADAIFNAALTPVGGTAPTSVSNCTAGGFANTPGLVSTSAPWNCMASFARQLFDPSKNPAGATIKTAFVGFGGNFASLGDSTAINTCHIGSKLKGDLCSTDATVVANRNPAPGSATSPLGGYGNGGFYAVNTPADVTASVKNFILTLGADTVTPLVTGASTIPIDDLNPNGFQNYGYLRMIAPNPSKPAKMLWQGDLKKYTLSAGALMSNGSSTVTVLNNLGQLNSASTTGVSTTDNWNATAGNDVAAGSGDGGSLVDGGAYPKVPMPTTAYINKIRPLFTDVGSVTQVTASTSGTTTTTTGTTVDKTVTLSTVASGAALTKVKPLNSSGALVTDLQTTIPQMFSSSNSAVSPSSPLKDLTIVQKKKLINYLGFNIPVYGPDDKQLVATRLDASGNPVVFTAATGSSPAVYYADPVPVPSDLGAPPSSAYLAMGGSIHSQPIQFSYLSDVSSTGAITNRQESVLYGSMEGALHLVNATTGVEQMAFVPSELLADDITSRGLRVDEENKSSTSVSDLKTPSAGVDGPWVADPAYRTTRGTSTTSATLNAIRMNVYGGLRMGGNSYYGLDLLDKSGDVVNPKLLFKIGPTDSGFSRMGQSWSKPVLTNVRYGNTIIRVMIIGGGYDTGYESPSFVPTTSTPAKGNAVYMVNATTGALIWSASYDSSATDGKQYMIHSIPSRVSVIDRDSDGLSDNIYFSDLGGQVFRADLNNTYGTGTSNFAVRVTRLANLGTTSTGAAITNGTNPRFYEAPAITIHRNGSSLFALVSNASGNRSNPLDVLPVVEGGKGLNSTTSPTPTPTPPLPVNNVYGIIDRDLASSNLMNSAYTVITHDVTLDKLQKDPQTLSTNISDTFFTGTTRKDGWYRSLSSRNNNTAGSFTGTVTELSESSYQYAASQGLPARKMFAGGLKAFEEKIAIKNTLYIPVYDPQGTGVSGSSCSARVVGETDLQKYCLPFGVCLTTTNTRNNATEARTGALYDISGSTISNTSAAVIGPGIRGVSLGDYSDTRSGGDCKSFALTGNSKDTNREYFGCTKQLVPTLWYEKQPNSNRVQ